MGEQPKEPSTGRKRYQTGDLVRTIGVSRASLTYYEQVGLVAPQRNPRTGMREYDNGDIFALFSFKALNTIGFTAREVAAEAGAGLELFDEAHLERYLATVTERIAYHEALRQSVDAMRAIRVRERLGPELQVEWVERHIFAEDGAENGYISFRSTEELDALGAHVPIAGFGILFDRDGNGRTT